MRPRPAAARLRRAVIALWRAADPTARRWLAAAAACVALGGAAAGLAPLGLKRVVDAAGDPRATAGPVALALAAYVLALALQRLAEQAQAYAYGRGEQRLTRRLSATAFEHMLRLPLAHHQTTRSGALSQSLHGGALGLRMVLTHLVLTVAPVVVQLAVGALVIATVLPPRAAGVLAAGLLVYAGVFALGAWRLAAPARAMAAAQVDVGAMTADGLMNVEALKSFTAEARFAARFDGLLRDREAHGRHFLVRRFAQGLAVAAVFAGTLGATLWAGAGTSVGGLVLINAYLLQLFRPLEQLGFAARDITQGLASLDRLLDILDLPPEAATPGAPPAPRTDPADIVFEAVSFAPAGGPPLLRDISFRARPGQTVAIVGPSGAGKSSLLRLILRLHSPTRGAVTLDGRPLEAWPLAALRQQMAVVSQDTILFNDTLGANIALAAEAADPEAIRAAVSDAQLAELLARLPDGLDAPVGERGMQLSGGERQRVAIARAALRGARLVLLDEATAALDPATEGAVWASAHRLAGRATLIVVTHRLRTIRDADLILVLDRGRIVERGRHEALVRAGGLYAALWRAQARTGPGAAPDPVTERVAPR